MSDDEIDRMDVARHLLPPPGNEVAGQLIAEVRRLRRELDALRGGYVDFPTCDPDTVLRMPVQKFALTDAEREALERICEAADDIIDEDKRANGVYWQDDAAAVAVVRGLLERLGGER